MDEFRGISMYQTCLMHARADRALRLVVAKQLEQFDLTMMEWLLLATVCAGPREGLTMSSVAAALDVTLPQITALANSLVRTKLIKQKVSSQDKRSRFLMPTITGKRLLTRVDEAVDQSMRTWLETIPREQLINYMETVETIAKLPTEKNS